MYRSPKPKSGVRVLGGVPMDKEKESIERLQKYIDKCIEMKYPKEEIEELYEELALLKTNYLIGELLEE